MPASLENIIVDPALVLFVAWERRSEYPLMPMRLFRNRGFSNGCVASFVLMTGVFGLGFLTAQYLQLVLHYNPLGVGLRLLPATGMALLLAPSPADSPTGSARGLW